MIDNPEHIEANALKQSGIQSLEQALKELKEYEYPDKQIESLIVLQRSLIKEDNDDDSKYQYTRRVTGTFPAALDLATVFIINHIKQDSQKFSEIETVPELVEALETRYTKIILQKLIHNSPLLTNGEDLNLLREMNDDASIELRDEDGNKINPETLEIIED